MNAKQFQSQAKNKLRRHFDEVIVEWPIAKGASDVLSPDKSRYSPRVDIAIGPFSTTRGNKYNGIRTKLYSEAPNQLKSILRKLDTNYNPRCALAIEVVFSGSSKHILGDLTNAGMMGLYGLVIANERQLAKVKRIHQYVKVIKEVEKAPADLLSNVVVLSVTDFINSLS